MLDLSRARNGLESGVPGVKGSGLDSAGHWFIPEARQGYLTSRFAL
jgi:hypothetical protein